MGEILSAAKGIVKGLKRVNVEKVFCVPGESFLPLLDALYDEPSLEVVACRHEGGASFMAEGYAKASGRPGVVLATRGVGAANLAIGVHTAYQDSTPLLVFLGQVHSRFRGREGFQEVDLENFFTPIAKWAVEIRGPERVPEIIDRAIRTAISGRPGPVVISLPEDLLAQEAEMEFGGPHFTRPEPRPSRTEVSEFARLLHSAKRPLIIAGGGVKLAGAEDELVRFAEKCNIPVVASFRRHDVFPNHHPLYAGHLGLGTPKNILQTVEKADCLIVFGSRLSEVTTQDYKIISSRHTLIHVDISEETLGKTYPPHLGIVADIKQALLEFLTIDVKINWKNWAKECNESYKEASTLTEVKDLYDEVMTILIKMLPRDTLLTNDAGNFAGWLHQYYPFPGKKTYIGPTSGAMGYGMPAAIGAKMAEPERTVLSLSGDGGFMMTVQELETAVRHKVGIIALVFNNEMYGTIRMHQEIHYPHRVIATDLGNIHFADLAKSLGAIGFQVSTGNEFEKALAKALNMKDIPVVIEILTDKERISVSKTITELRNSRRHE